MLNSAAARSLAAGAIALGALALVAWFFLLPDAPPPTPLAAAPGEPWAGANQLVGAWRLRREQDFAEGNCRNREVTDYTLTLNPAVKNDDALRGTLRVGIARTGVAVKADAGACRGLDRSEDYRVAVAMSPYRQIEMTMAASACTENGRDCAVPLSDRKGAIALKHGELVFGSESLTRAR